MPFFKKLTKRQTYKSQTNTRNTYHRDCKVWITSIHSNKHHDPAFQWQVTWQTADLLTSWDIETPQLWSQLVWLSSFPWSISYLRRCTAAECGPGISMHKTLKGYQKLCWHRIMYHLTKTSKIANLGPTSSVVQRDFEENQTMILSRESTCFSLASTTATTSNQQQKQKVHWLHLHLSTHTLTFAGCPWHPTSHYGWPRASH